MAGQSAPPVTQRRLGAIPSRTKSTTKLESKVATKMADKMLVVRLDEQMRNMDGLVSQLRQNSRSDHELLVKLSRDTLMIQESLGMLDEAARAAAAAAAAAAANASRGEPSVEVSDDRDLFEDERKRLAQLEADLLACRNHSAAAEAGLTATCKELAAQLEPLLPLEKLVNRDILLDLIPRKAEQSKLDALVVQFDSLQTVVDDLQGKGLPAEVLEGLEMLKDMRGMKATLGTHATKLASILADMATHEDVSSVGSLVQDLDAKTQAELEKEAKRMVDAMCVYSQARCLSVCLY